ncbi:hypothetical protein F4703DRAFT_1274734 [Phycomyces blakesleeanus]
MVLIFFLYSIFLRRFVCVESTWTEKEIINEPDNSGKHKSSSCVGDVSVVPDPYFVTLEGQISAHIWGTSFSVAFIIFIYYSKIKFLITTSKKALLPKTIQNYYYFNLF